MATFKEAVQYAQQNPNSDFAKNFEVGIKSGQFIEPAKKEGIDLTPFVQLQQNNQQSAEQPVEQKSNNPMNPQGSEDLTVKDAAKGLFNNLIKPVIKDVARTATNFVNAAEVATGKEKTQPFSGKFLGSVPAIGFNEDNTEMAPGKQLLDTGGAALDIALAGDLPGVKNVAKQASKDIAEGIVKPVVKNIVEKKIARAAEKEVVSITDKITPKLTVKETRLATKEGRLLKGKDPTLLRGGTPDTVIPSDKVIKSSQTIQREIPGAAKMKEPELYTALEGRTSDMAQKLKPEMRKVPIKPETIDKITSDWETIKKSQLNDPYTPNNVNVKKLQSDFETRLRKSKADSMDDLWETRKGYDASVPINVKQATSLSSDSLQAQKEIWLQNRKILNDAMNDLENGMGETSKKAFADMTDMYHAKENLLSKAKVVNEGQLSKIKQWVKENPWKSAVGGYLGGKAVEKTTGINIPVI